MAEDEDRPKTLEEVLERLRRRYPYQLPTDREGVQRQPRKQKRTWDALDRLRAIRLQKIKDGRPIGRLDACELADIDPKTAKKHARELWDHWDEPQYDTQKWESGN